MQLSVIVCNHQATNLNQKQPFSTKNNLPQPTTTALNHKTRYSRTAQQIDGSIRHDRYEYKTLRVFPSYPCQRGVPFETPSSYGRQNSLGVGEEKTATRL